MRLGGIYAPITTPFDGRGELDVRATSANVHAMIGAGLDGIVVAGSTGEAPLLDERERSALLEAVRSAAKDKQVLMGVGAESTRQTIERAKAAGAAGANVALCVAPHYFGAAAMTDAALRAHYRAVADASPIPVALYTIPKYMHFALSAPLVADLATHDNIIGIKDSSGDATIFAGYLPAQSDHFSVLTGNGSSFLAAIRAGARGGILAVADFAPALSRAVFDNHVVGRADEATAAQERLAPLAVEIVARLSIAGVKAACDAVGLVGGRVRMPLMNLDDAGMAKVKALLADAGVGPLQQVEVAA